MKFLKTLSKYLILGFGTISLCCTLGVGIAGKVYEKQAIELYNKVKNELNSNDNKNIFQNIKNVVQEIRNFDMTKTINDLKTKFLEVKNFLGTSTNNDSNNIGSLIKQLENIYQKMNDNSNSFTEEAKTNLNKAISSLKEIEQNTNKIIEQIDSNINNFEGPLKEYLDKDSPLLNQVDQYTDKINEIYLKISNWMQETPSSNIENYYSLTTTLLIAIPSTIIGIGILGAFTTWIKYKNIDGKLYSRNKNKAEKEAIIHIKKIVSKYPGIRKKM